MINLHDLSHIWQGMVGTLCTVVENERVLLSLWKHECSRVFSDRCISICVHLIFVKNLE
jgi:dynein heavy chain, axonemal